MRPDADVVNVQALLDVEVALATAEADVGVIPASCVNDIRAVAKAELFDVAALHDEAERAGNLVIPLVRRLTEAVAAVNPESARYVHYGATSQDIIDTALVVQLRSTAPSVHDSLTRAIGSAAGMARRFATAPMVGRTLLQHASPTTFGVKAAGWLDMLARCRRRLGEAIDGATVVQFGGASGTLASFGDAGLAVAEAFARVLSLSVPEMPWHTQRDRLAGVAAALGTTCGALGKVGRDLTLLAQPEVGEAMEAPASGRGGSSSMPHKQNPVRAITAVRGAIRAPGLVATLLSAMPHEHERAAGAWHAEWETMPELLRLTKASADAVADALADLVVDTERMRRNLEGGGGVAMAEALSVALAHHIARTDAMRLVERLSRAAEREGTRLRDAAAADSEVARWLTPSDLDRVLRPENYLGAAPAFVERVLQRWGV